MRNKTKEHIDKDITISKYKFRLEIYPALVSWEIFPKGYEACLYALENKDKINKIVKQKYVLEK
tara:strand:- start:576 stop:767 length:192 start_codon:yes stop_codon:yes gene_type:complete